MRISGGELKGRKVGQRNAFRKRSGHDGLRPTSSKVREAVFDILKNWISDASFLDLYAGTGAVGFEALSRGAGSVTFVESDRVRSRAISDFVGRAAVQDKTSVHSLNALTYLRTAAKEGTSFDIIFADPPYASPELPEVMQVIVEHGILKAGGFLMIEHSSKAAPQEGPGPLGLVKKYRYGDTMLSLYRRAQ